CPNRKARRGLRAVTAYQTRRANASFGRPPAVRSAGFSPFAAKRAKARTTNGGQRDTRRQPGLCTQAHSTGSRSGPWIPARQAQGLSQSARRTQTGIVVLVRRRVPVAIGSPHVPRLVDERTATQHAATWLPPDGNGVRGTTAAAVCTYRLAGRG